MQHLTFPVPVFFKIVITVWMLRSLLHRLLLCRVQRCRPPPVAALVELLADGRELSNADIRERMQLKDRTHLREYYLEPVLALNLSAGAPARQDRPVRREFLATRTASLIKMLRKGERSTFVLLQLIVSNGKAFSSSRAVRQLGKCSSRMAVNRSLWVGSSRCATSCSTM